MQGDPQTEPIARWVASRANTALYLNATAVCVAGTGVLILGAPGSGKSSLALQLLAYGASLIADDGLWLDPDATPPRLSRPSQAVGFIEARGVGLIHGGEACPDAPLGLAVDLDRPELDRLPPRRLVAIGNAQVPLIRGAGHPTLAPALLLMARNGCADV